MNIVRTISAEVQKHGFLWEESIKRSVFRMSDAEISSANYTAKHDIPAALNHLDAGVNVSIKTTKATSVDMADAIRVFEAVSSEALHLVLVFYKQSAADKKTLEQVVEIDLTASAEHLFGSITKEELTELRHLITAIPHGRHATPEEKAVYENKKKELESKGGLIKLHPKIDSKSQRRLQCSFHWQNFLKTFPSRVVATLDASGQFRGASVLKEVNSGVRVFHPKP